MCPGNFGEPTSRNRWWRIMYNHKTCRWSSVFSIEELAGILLCPPDSEFKIGPQIFMTASPSETAKAESTKMCPSSFRFLKAYKQKAPNKVLLDLATNPDFALRTELVSGALMTLTTNTKIWPCPQFWFSFWDRVSIVNLSGRNVVIHACALSILFFSFIWCLGISQSVRSKKQHRFWTGKEMLASLGYPCRAATANALGTDAWLGSYRTFWCVVATKCSCFLLIVAATAAVPHWLCLGC